MRKILLLAICLILLGSCGKSENALKGPEGMPSLDKFVLTAAGDMGCGEVRQFEFVSENEHWIKYFLGTSENPLMAGVSRQIDGKIIEDAWLDKNMDGDFDERFSSFAAIGEKYPSPCDAVTK